MKNLAGFLATLLIGLFLVGFGTGFLVLEMLHPPTHTTHVFVFAAIAMLGALVLRPDQIAAAFKVGAEAAGPYLPWGRRTSDRPPTAPPPKDGAP